MTNLQTKTGNISETENKGIVFYINRVGDILGGEKIVEAFPTLPALVKEALDSAPEPSPLGSAMFLPIKEGFLGCGVIIASGESVDFEDFIASWASIVQGAEQVAAHYEAYDVASKYALSSHSLKALNLPDTDLQEVLTRASEHFKIEIEIWD